MGESINLPFLNVTLRLREGRTITAGQTYFIRFSDYDNTVYSYQSKVNIGPFSSNSSSVLSLSLSGTNKSKIADYLNATADILSKTELERKNLYATNTIKFIDSTLNAVNDNLKNVTDAMNRFRKQNKVFDVSAELLEVSAKLKSYESQKDLEQDKLNYLNALENYLRTKTDYTKIAAPSSVGIDESNISNSVSKIIALSIERQNLEYTTQEGNVLFKDLDRQIDSEKNVLLETIKATVETINIGINSINRNIAELDAELSKLPEDQQEYLKIQRQLDLSQEAYDLYLAKRGEAAIVKAANVSDISTIERAKVTEP